MTKIPASLIRQIASFLNWLANSKPTDRTSPDVREIAQALSADLDAIRTKAILESDSGDSGDSRENG